MEAMSCELPIVATNVRGLGELVKNNINGLLANAEDASALADAIKYLIANPTVMQTFGKNGRKMIVENYNFNEKIEAFKKIVCEYVSTL